MRPNLPLLALGAVAGVAGLCPACTSEGTAGTVADSAATDSASQPELVSELTSQAESSMSDVPDANPASPEISAPADRCSAATDCAFSYFGTMVQSPDDCFCLGCPGYPVTVAVNLARANAWQEYCADWAVTAGCQEIDCGNPGRPVCTNGECVGGPGTP